MNPLLLRHLYSSVRRNRFFWLLTLYLLGVGFLTIAFTLLVTLSSILDQFNQDITISMLDLFTQGRVLYWFATILLIMTAGQIVPISALGALAGERENRTLDLLVTTTLRSHDIILGKLSATFLTGAVYLLAPLPLLLTGFWMGSVMPIELLLTCIFVLVTMLVKVAWAMFLSSLTRKSIAAVLVFFGLNFAIVPIAFTFIITLVSVYDAWYYRAPLTLPFLIEGLIQYSWLFLAMLHPIAAAGVTEAYGLNESTWFILKLPVGRYGSTTSGTLYLPSPWIGYTALALVAAGLFLFISNRRLKRTER